jgi:endo-beta-N-acetylglucosaminidase D
MERPSMFMNWWNQHWENGHTPQNNLHAQQNPYQIFNDILQRHTKYNLETKWKHKRPQIAKCSMLEASQYLTSNYTSEP